MTRALELGVGHGAQWSDHHQQWHGLCVLKPCSIIEKKGQKFQKCRLTSALAPESSRIVTWLQILRLSLGERDVLTLFVFISVLLGKSFTTA